MRLVSRAQWGARDYRRPNGATLYSGKRRGVKFHYLGTTYYDRHHAQCAAYVRQLQAQHMDGNGWSDIGYSFAVCTHGYVYEGRGLRRRNSANGNTSLNNQDYAVLLLVGSSGMTRPTDAQLHGARDALEYCRKSGPAGTWVGGHRDGYATACPGTAVYAWVKAGAPRPTPSKPSTPPKKEDDVSAYELWAYKGRGEKADAYHYLRSTNAAVKSLTAQVGALSAALGKLAEGGGLDAAEIKAAAEAGAEAALEKLGETLTDTPA